jgi:hypothetical protein
MKKIIYNILFIFLSFVCISTVNAGSLTINGGDSVYVGNTITVSVNFNNIAGRFKITSSDQSILAGGNEDFYDNQTASFTFTAKSPGTVTVSVTPVGAIGDYDNEVYTGGSRALTIRVVKKNTTPSVDVNKVYSKNNYLSGLSIDDYELSPEFNKETLEYEVELEPGTEKININTDLESRVASVRGDGEVSITDGVNTIEIVVTAENGNERVYKIIANSPEKDPINIKINKNKYTVVKRRELIGTKDGYEESEVKIEKFDIPALYNDVTKVTLVGIKDSEGNITLASYDSKTGVYELYNEFRFDLMNLYIHEKNDSEYEKTKIKINGLETTGYKLEGVTDYYLVYATNTITGYEGYYLYDIKENSVQRYDTTMLDVVKDEKDKFFSIVLVLSCVCFLTMLFLLIEVNKDNQRKNEE